MVAQSLWLLRLIDLSPFRKGLIWMSLAAIAEVPPAVSTPNDRLLAQCPLIHRYLQVLLVLNLNGDLYLVRFPPIIELWAIRKSAQLNIVRP